MQEQPRHSWFLMPSVSKSMPGEAGLCFLSRISREFLQSL